MSQLISRANSVGWVAGNLLTASQVNTMDQNSVDVADYLEGLMHDVTLYGATGDGVTDDSTAIADALTAADADDAPVYFPPGAYACNNLTWPVGVALLGQVGRSFLINNHASNPIISVANGDGAVYPSHYCHGLEFSFGVTNTGGKLVSYGLAHRAVFSQCYFNGTDANPGSGAGLVDLGSAGWTTFVTFSDCAFRINSDEDTNSKAVGYADGTVYVNLRDCRISLVSSARAATNALVEASHVLVDGCHFILSSATAASTVLRMIRPKSGGSAKVTGTHFTDPASGIVHMFGPLESNVELRESGNRLPSTGLVASSFASTLPFQSSTREGRHQALSQSGGGSLSLDTSNYSRFTVTIEDATSFTIAPAAGQVGMTFDLILYNNAGTNSGTISYENTLVGGFGTVGTGAAPSSVMSNQRYETMRFMWANATDGARWYLMGSALGNTT